MTEIIMCCGEATMIFSGTSADGKPIHFCTCVRYEDGENGIPEGVRV